MGCQPHTFVEVGRVDPMGGHHQLPVTAGVQTAPEHRFANQRAACRLGEDACLVGVVRDDAARYAEPRTGCRDQLLWLVGGDAVVVRIVDPADRQGGQQIEHGRVCLVLSPGRVRLGHGVGDEGASGPPVVDGPNVLQPHRSVLVGQRAFPSRRSRSMARRERDVLGEVGRIEPHYGNATLIELVHDHVSGGVEPFCDDENRTGGAHQEAGAK